MVVSKHTAALPPPLRGRAGERGSPGRDLSSWPPLSLPLPRKGGGNERTEAPSRTNFSRKFLNDFNVVLLCMGLFSTFLVDRRQS